MMIGMFLRPLKNPTCFETNTFFVAAAEILWTFKTTCWFAGQKCQWDLLLFMLQFSLVYIGATTR
jgi:hypothetical protein